MKKILGITLLLIVLSSCGTEENKQAINQDLFNQGQNISKQLYSVIDDIENIENLKIDEISTFVNQETTTMTPEEREYVDLVKELNIYVTGYHAGEVSNREQVKNESIDKVNEIIKTLENEYGVTLEK